MYTHTGRRIKSLSEIEHGRVYVASGSEPFRRLSYPSKGSDWSKVPQELKKAGQNAEEIGYEERMERLHAASTAMRITIYTTDASVDGVSVTLSDRDIYSFEYLLRRLAHLISLPQNTGAIRKLYDADAREITSGSELTPDGNYIATGSFKGSVKDVRRRAIILAEQLGTQPPLWHDEGADDNDHGATGGGGGSSSPTTLPPIHRVKNTTPTSPRPVRRSGGTKLPSVGRAKAVDSPQRIDVSLAKLDKKRGRLVAKTHNTVWLQSLWESLRDRWTHSDGGVAVCLSSLIAHMAKVEPLLDMPYAWEYALLTLIENGGSGSE